MPEPEYQANEGSADQLPRGEASRLNENTNVADPMADAAGDVMPQPMMMPEAPPSTYKPLDTDAEQILFGDPEPGAVARFNAQTPPRLSSGVLRHLRLLRDAASAPGAPDSLKAVYTALVTQLENEIRT